MSAPALELRPARHRSEPPSRWRPEVCGGPSAGPSTPSVRCGTAAALYRPDPTEGAEVGARLRHPASLSRRRQARRRRLVLGVVAGTILVALALPWGGTGGHPLATPGPVLAGATSIAPGPYVVQPGDTMWRIAVRLDPTGDPRAIVAQLEGQVGSDTLQPGEHLQLP